MLAVSSHSSVITGVGSPGLGEGARLIFLLSSLYMVAPSLAVISVLSRDRESWSSEGKMERWDKLHSCYYNLPRSSE